MAVQKSILNGFSGNSVIKYDIKEIIKHELKTPLASNVVVLNLLLNGKFGSLNKSQKEILINVISSSASSLLILNNYLAYLEFGDLSFKKCDIVELIKSLVFDLELIFKDRRQKFFIDCDFEKCFLNADEKELKRVFYNIILILSELSDIGSKTVVTIKKNKNFVEIFLGNKTYRGEFFQNKKDKYRKISSDMSLEICEKIIKQHKGTFEINPFKNSFYAYKMTFNIAQ